MPTTVTVQMFYAGNFADMDTDETDQDNENPNIVLGTYNSLVITSIDEIDGEDDGVILDDEYVSSDFLRYDVGGGLTSVALDNTSLYNATILLGDGSSFTARVLVIQAANGDVFISEFPSEPLDGLAIQSITLDSLNSSDAAGINQGFSDVQNASIVCYGVGTLITTSRGDVPVETLQSGDLVKTLDHGFQPIRWIHRDTRPLDTLAADEKPVLIAENALGCGKPHRDLVVSPQHRMLVGDGGQLEDYFEDVGLAPSKSLTSLKGIRHMQGRKTVTWIHFACDRHEIVFANGCLSESLLLGDMVVNGLSVKHRRELANLFPKARLGFAMNGPAAREFLKVTPVRQRIEAIKVRAAYVPVRHNIQTTAICQSG